jgi:hypothetical protein
MKTYKWNVFRKPFFALKKSDTIMKRQIAPHERLSVTLRFLATGRTYEDLLVKLSAAMSLQALGVIISEKCTAVCE